MTAVDGYLQDFWYTVPGLPPARFHLRPFPNLPDDSYFVTMGEAPPVVGEKIGATPAVIVSPDIFNSWRVYVIGPASTPSGTYLHEAPSQVYQSWKLAQEAACRGLVEEDARTRLMRSAG